MSKDGVGTYTAIIEKMEESVWPFIDIHETNYPQWDEIA